MTTVRPDGARLSWHEEGRISWAGHDGTATRDYSLAPGTGPASALVVFPDGRPFHPLDLAAGSWAAQHLCSPDTYDVHYRAAGADELHIEWSVNGPHKDLLLRSVLTRSVLTGSSVLTRKGIAE